MRAGNFTAVWQPCGGELLVDRNQARQLRVADRIWISPDKPLTQQYEAILGQYHGGPPERIDFTQRAQAVEAINAWIATQTQGKIQHALTADDLDPEIGMVATSAIYFRSRWLDPFDAKNSRSEGFWLNPRRSIETAMMKQENTFHYVEIPGEAQAVKLPYTNGLTSMIVILPHNHDVRSLVNRLSYPVLNAWLAKLTGARVRLSIPKFRISSRRELTDALRGLGANSAFSLAADFTGISPAGRLRLSRVLHQAQIEVDEDGTEAAAATEEAFAAAAAEPPGQPVIELRVDHPFLFLIRDEATGAILFMGVVNNPLA